MRDIKKHGFDPWVRKTPWRRKWQPTPVLLPRESHRQRSLVGYSPWGHKELDVTKRLTNQLIICLRPVLPSVSSLKGRKKVSSCLLMNLGSFPRGSDSKESASQCRKLGFDPWVRKIPWRREWQPTPVFLPWKPHRWRSLVCCSPWGGKEMGMTEGLM